MASILPPPPASSLLFRGPDPSNSPSLPHYRWSSHSEKRQPHQPTLATEATQPKPKVTIRTRLSQICKEGRPEIAVRIFDAIPTPPTLLWNTIIIGLICNAMPHEALRLYARMNFSKSPSRPDFYTFSSTLKACAQTRQLKLGKSIHCQILRSQLNPSRILGNSILSMYSSCVSADNVRLDVVRLLFDRMRKRNVITWNTVIAWYVKRGRPREALAQFKIMMEMGIQPSVVSFVNVVPAVAEIRDGKLAKVLYGLLLKFGSTFSDDPFAVSSAIFMYCEILNVESARKVFDLCNQRNIEVWNTMIDGYVQNDRPGEAIELFLEVANSELLVPDEVTCLAGLMAISQIQMLKFGHQVHAYVIKIFKELPIILFNGLIVMYSRCNSVETAFLVFEKMVEKDIVSWNTMASASVQNGFDIEGLMLVYEMQKQGFRIDSITATTLLSAASNLRNLSIGKQTHAYLFRHGIKFEGMDSYLIDMYAKSGLIETAENLFLMNDADDRDQVTWNAMIASYAQNGKINEALMVFKQMIVQNQLPNSVTVASILPTCSATGGISFGKQLHGYAIHHLLDDSVFVSTALVDMYSKCGDISDAETLFHRMSQRNSVSFTTMILGYGHHGLGEKALSVFYAMPNADIKPDAITFVAVLTACSYSGLVEEGLRIFKSMEKEHMIQPAFEHCSCVVDMLGRAGRVVEAYEFAKEMQVEGNMVWIWGSLLGACRIHGEYEMGKLVAEQLFKTEDGKGVTGYRVLLSNMHAEEGRRESVDRVRQEMREKGLSKEIGCSWIEVGGLMHTFVSRDQNHPMSESIYATLERLATVMSLDDYRPSVGFHKNGVL
ncbi:pentatricopeptide repeat-containing protein At3g22150, chloroplastic [Aristolochia californica]|uniref:pentatricopeptide repeat-containing protein At3g22150, chloroplastic n=1 Tax=Aristolochia californica TaxID=171875 RepID=UPI0035D693D0